MMTEYAPPGRRGFYAVLPPGAPVTATEVAAIAANPGFQRAAKQIARLRHAADSRVLCLCLAIEITILHRYGPVERCERRTQEIGHVYANAVVALKGAATVIATPDGQCWSHEGGNVGLAISGSGDTLAGIITGLAARGAPLEQACAWGIALHALAGEQLALRFGLLGYLAREIPAEVPALLRHLAA